MCMRIIGKIGAGEAKLDEGQTLWNEGMCTVLETHISKGIYYNVYIIKLSRPIMNYMPMRYRQSA